MNAPIAAPMSISRGIATHALSSPELGRNHSIKITLARIVSGPIEMSRPPPPERIAGVDAIATIANGASVASSPGQLPGLPKFGSATTLATSSASASTAANTKGLVRSSSRITPPLRRTPRRSSGG